MKYAGDNGQGEANADKVIQKKLKRNSWISSAVLDAKNLTENNIGVK